MKAANGRRVNQDLKRAAVVLVAATNAGGD
jgi:hypothetical protein